METKFYEWKWSIGLSYYKSPRKKKEIKLDEEESIENINNFAIKQSLEEYLPINTLLLDKSENNNRREEIDDKISNRELLFHRGTNPFLTDSNYAEDISVRDNFLKPINTTSIKNNI